MIADGRVLYRLKRPYRDGSTHVLFEPTVFLERLAALVPRPRVHLVTYRGELAPPSPDRALMAPEPSPVRTEPVCPGGRERTKRSHASSGRAEATGGPS